MYIILRIWNFDYDVGTNRRAVYLMKGSAKLVRAKKDSKLYEADYRKQKGHDKEEIKEMNKN